MSAAEREAPPPQFLTVGEVAALLRIKPRTVYAWVALDKIPFLKPSPNRLLFDREAILGWLEAQGRGGTGEKISNVVPLAR